MAAPTILIVTVFLLAIALYSHYTLYASMYSIPDWTQPLGLVAAAAVLVGAIAFVMFGK